MHPDDVPKSPQEVDKIISAEIPKPEDCPELHKLVKEKMMHGPCEGYNPQSPCLLNPKKQCEKEYPKHCQEFTTMTEDGVTTYRRRTPEQAGGFTMEKTCKGKKVYLSNKWVVPHNKWLLLKYQGHINVELVNLVKSVKYLYKYILKGADKCHVEIVKIGADGKQKTKTIDEIKTFRQGRYYDSTQSTHRLLGYSMSYMYPPVTRLAFHLENEQIVVYDKTANMEDVLQKYEKTQLIQWFKLNQEDPRANHLLYDQILQFYRWDDSKREWIRRKDNRFKGIKGPNDPLSDMIGRIPVISLNHYQREKFFLRLLLHHVPGAKCFEDLRTIDNPNGEKEICGTFQDACIKRHLTENDEEAENAMSTAFNNIKNDQVLKNFYVMLMIHQMAASPWTIFQKFKSELCSDQMYKANVNGPTEEMINNVLLELKILFEYQDKDMADFIGKENMPIEVSKEKAEAQEYQAEIDYNTEMESEKAEKNIVMLNDGQKEFVQTILQAAGVGPNGDIDESRAKGKKIEAIFFK